MIKLQGQIHIPGVIHNVSVSRHQPVLFLSGQFTGPEYSDTTAPHLCLHSSNFAPCGEFHLFRP